MHGSTLVIDAPPTSQYQKCWLYSFIQQTEKQDVKAMKAD